MLGDRLCRCGALRGEVRADRGAVLLGVLIDGALLLARGALDALRSVRAGGDQLRGPLPGQRLERLDQRADARAILAMLGLLGGIGIAVIVVDGRRVVVAAAGGCGVRLGRRRGVVSVITAVTGRRRCVGVDGWLAVVAGVGWRRVRVGVRGGVVGVRMRRLDLGV
jgi:hypothetical protein